MRLPYIGTALVAALFYDGGKCTAFGNASTFRAHPHSYLNTANRSVSVVVPINCTNELNYLRTRWVRSGIRRRWDRSAIAIWAFPSIGRDSWRRQFFFFFLGPSRKCECLDGQNGFSGNTACTALDLFQFGSTLMRRTVSRIGWPVGVGWSKTSRRCGSGGVSDGMRQRGWKTRSSAKRRAGVVALPADGG